MLRQHLAGITPAKKPGINEEASSRRKRPSRSDRMILAQRFNAGFAEFEPRVKTRCYTQKSLRDGSSVPWLPTVGILIRHPRCSWRGIFAIVMSANATSKLTRRAYKTTSTTNVTFSAGSEGEDEAGTTSPRRNVMRRGITSAILTLRREKSTLRYLEPIGTTPT